MIKETKIKLDDTQIEISTTYNYAMQFTLTDDDKRIASTLLTKEEASYLANILMTMSDEMGGLRNDKNIC